MHPTSRSLPAGVLTAALLLAGCAGHASRPSASASAAPARAVGTTTTVAPATAEPTTAPDHCASVPPTTPPALPTPVDHFVTLEGHRIHVREWVGRGPTILLMHGFPDNLHLYDALVPQLAGHHVVAFDFIGWGDSDKPSPSTYPYTADQQIKEVNAVVTQLHLAPIIEVVHDSSGPPGIDWAMRHQASVARLVLLNTYYNPVPGLRPPEAIAIFSAHALDKVQDLIADDVPAGKELFDWQVGGFFANAKARAKYLPELWAAFLPELPAFRALNYHLLDDVVERAKRAPALRTFTKPVTIAWGAGDPYLNLMVANRFHQLFPRSRLDVIRKANHYVQMDQPREVAAAILGAC